MALMKALLCRNYGSPETLGIGDVPIPKPGAGEIRIRVHAAGVNFPDSLIIQNKYQFHPPLPFSPGSEAAGIVDATGPGVAAFQPGDRVAALTSYGAFAEFVTAKADNVTIVPPAMGLETASAFTLAYATTHHAFRQRAGLQPGETVLVLGAAGGVGLAAVELAKAMGAKVIAAASSAEKLDVARQHGADEIINYAEADLRQEVKTITAGRGVDVVYDPVGGKFAEPAFRSIAWEGRYLVIGFAAGEIPSLPLNLALLKGASIIGVFWGEFLARAPQVHQENMAELYQFFAEGKLRPFISERFPLAQGGKAIQWMMDRQAIGKIIITLPASD